MVVIKHVNGREGDAVAFGADVDAAGWERRLLDGGYVVQRRVLPQPVEDVEVDEIGEQLERGTPALRVRRFVPGRIRLRRLLHPPGRPDHDGACRRLFRRGWSADGAHPGAQTQDRRGAPAGPEAARRTVPRRRCTRPSGPSNRSRRVSVGLGETPRTNRSCSSLSRLSSSGPALSTTADGSLRARAFSNSRRRTSAARSKQPPADSSRSQSTKTWPRVRRARVSSWCPPISRSSSA